MYGTIQPRSERPDGKRTVGSFALLNSAEDGGEGGIAFGFPFGASLRMMPLLTHFVRAERVGFEPTVGINPRQFSRLEP